MAYPDKCCHSFETAANILGDSMVHAFSGLSRREQERYPVHAALGANQPNLVGQILRSTRHNATNLNAWINKCTPLTYAARFGLLEVARELVTHGADINRREERFGMTPLIVAIISEQVDLVHLLLEKGASPNCQEEVYGMTGLMFVVFQNDVGLAIALMLRGANPNIQNSKANTALLLAVEANNRNDIVRLLLDKGADPNIQGENGMTALMMAVAVNNRKVVEMIIEKRPQFDLMNDFNETALGISMDENLYHSGMKEYLIQEQIKGKHPKDNHSLLPNHFLRGKINNINLTTEYPKVKRIPDYDPPAQRPGESNAAYQRRAMEEFQMFMGCWMTDSFREAKESMMAMKKENLGKNCSTCNREPSEVEEFKKCSVCKLSRYCGVACQKRDWKAHRKICKQPEEATSDPTNQSKEPKDNGVKGADDAAADLTKNMEDLSVTKKSKMCARCHKSKPEVKTIKKCICKTKRYCSNECLMTDWDMHRIACLAARGLQQEQGTDPSESEEDVERKKPERKKDLKTGKRMPNPGRNEINRTVSSDFDIEDVD